jgi:hypothetical protein
MRGRIREHRHRRLNHPITSGIPAWGRYAGQGKFLAVLVLIVVRRGVIALS